MEIKKNTSWTKPSGTTRGEILGYAIGVPVLISVVTFFALFGGQ